MQRMLLGSAATVGLFAYWRHSQREKFKKIAAQNNAVQALQAMGVLSIDDLAAQSVPYLSFESGEAAWSKVQPSLSVISQTGQVAPINELVATAGYVMDLLGKKK